MIGWMWVGDLRARLRESVYARGAIALMAGTGVSQVIAILISPVLTRLYSPEEFGHYGNFMSVVSVVAVVATLRYETAVVLPTDQARADGLLKLSMTLALAAAAVFQCFIWTFGLVVPGVADFQELSTVASSAVALLAVSQTLVFWMHRQRGFVRLSRARVVQAISAATVNITLGVLRTGSIGLVCAVLVGQAVFCATLLREHVAGIYRAMRHPWRGVRVAAHEYRDLAIKGTPALLVSTMAVQSLVVLSMTFFGEASAGFVVLIDRIVGVASTVIGTSIGEVFYRKLAEQTKNQFESIIRVTGLLVVLSLCFHGAVFVGLQWFFVPIFGEVWEPALDLALLYLVVSGFSFVFAPLTILFNYFRIQGINLLWQLTWLLTNAAVFWLGSSWGWSFDAVFAVFVIKQSVLYLVGICGFLWYARAADRTRSAGTLQAGQ